MKHKTAKEKNYDEAYRKNNRGKYVQYQREYRRRLRYKVLCHYGGNPPMCACCGEKEVKFLAIDHINNDGAECRRKRKGSIEWWILKEKYPIGFQVLCHNCNMAKGFWGKCPHQESRFSEPSKTDLINVSH